MLVGFIFTKFEYEDVQISQTMMLCFALVQRIIKTYMLNHLTRNNMIATEQHGFLRGKSCITNLLLFMDSLTQARDSGPVTDSIFFDFSKAVDKVPRQQIIHKLQEYGIIRNILKWIESFLTSRTFQFRVGFTASNASAIHSGVPQGSHHHHHHHHQHFQLHATNYSDALLPSNHEINRLIL